MGNLIECKWNVEQPRELNIQDDNAILIYGEVREKWKFLELRLNDLKTCSIFNCLAS
jgi:uncharacterized protein YdeI (BOF family)